MKPAPRTAAESPATPEPDIAEQGPLSFVNSREFANYAVKETQSAAAERPKISDPEKHSHLPEHVRNFLNTATLIRSQLEPVWVTKHVKDWDTTMADAPVTPPDEVARREAAKHERESRDFRLRLVPKLVDTLPHEADTKPRIRPATVRINPGEEKKINVKKVDKEALINSGPLPEIVPVLSGLRARSKERRAAKIQARIEKLAYDQELMHFIGEQVIEGKSYSHSDPAPSSSVKPYPLSKVHRAIHSTGDKDKSYKPKKIERPHSLLTKGPGRRLGKIYGRREKVLQRTNTLLEAYPDIDGKKQRFKLFFDEYDKGADGSQKQSWGERRAIGVAARKYRNSNRMVTVYDRAFRHVVTKPSRDARGLTEKRDNLVLKAAALREDKARVAKRKNKK